VIPFMGPPWAVSGRRRLRLLLCTAQRAEDSDRGFRPQFHIHGHHRGILQLFPLHHPRPGISFELPILIFFLALFGIVTPHFLWRNIRYAILAVFIVAAFICPVPTLDHVHLRHSMLALYLLGIGVAWWVHPARRKAKEAAK